MTTAHKSTTLDRPLKALEVDPSWYQSYWYGRPQPEPRKRSSRSLQVLAWAAVFLVGVYFAL
jgi:hypothetical protein